MANSLYLVYSQKPDQISRDDYHDWYVHHAQENIVSPGFVSAQRYSVREVERGEETGEEQHLAVYEYEGPMSQWRVDLSRRIETGEVLLPEWFGQIKFASWNCRPEGSRLLPKR